jgi:hypothetical protein
MIRGLLLASGPMNVVGAICFAPFFPFARQMVGLPEPGSFYLWVLSSWILAFGAAYWWQGWTGQINRGVLAIGGFGKLTFGVALIAYGSKGAHPVAAFLGALPDMMLGVVFAIWLLAATE